MRKLFISLLLMVAFTANAQSILGNWKTIDDETGKEKSVVEIFEQSGKIYGRIIQLFRAPDQDQNPKCVKCEDDRKDQFIIGMQIIRDMESVDGYFKKGSICDPKTGKIYKCEFWLDGQDANKLILRGYWGFFYRTQTWIRM